MQVMPHLGRIASTAPWRGGSSREETTAIPNPGGRYQQLSLIASGGMGTVWRAKDTLLDRDVALKVLAGPVTGAARRRFLHEARLVGGMDHPAIVAIHDAGTLADGRPFFSMKLVHGGTFGDLLASGAELRGLVDILRRVSLAVAWAHSWRGGVLHRDLKPSNVMVGAYGEVYVLDWGIAVVREASRRAEIGAGTPGYLAPEARVRSPGRLDARTDVYSLGAMLRDVLRRADRSEPELERLAALATVPEVSDRLASAESFAERLGAWIDGSERRAEAQRLVEAADALVPIIRSLTTEAEAASIEARRLLDSLPAWAPPRDKRVAWAYEDRARAARAAVEEQGSRQEEALQIAVRTWPDLEPAHDRLAMLYRERHDEAERRGEPLEAAAWARLVGHHDRSGRAAAWVRGGAWLSLDTDPSGAEVLLFRAEPAAGREIARFRQRLGTTPLVEVPIPHGDAILLLLAPDRAPVRLPIRAARGEHWVHQAPDAPEPHPVLLPPDAGASVRYVPAGWFDAGGDDEATDSLPAGRFWVDGFLVQRFPVTVSAYFAFLNALVADGRPAEAEARAPTRVRDEGRTSFPCWRRDGQVLVPDFAGVLGSFDERWPITNIGWPDAVAYADWWAALTGRPWRLPHDLEWEKAARGTDRRAWPWGNRFDPAFASMIASHADPPERRAVDAFPFDRSPYGLRGMAGNVRDWCNNRYSRGGACPGGALDPHGSGGDPRYRMVRGGAWIASASQCRCAARFVSSPDGRTPVYGIRLACSIPRG
jgi:serine/threonine-protein kinase